MRVRIPEKLDKYRHGDVVEAIRKLNPQLKIPSKTSWREGLPDLEEPLKHIAVELELSSLHTGWGQCLCYYRQGSPEIHLILAPQLYVEYMQKEQEFVIENPIPNVVVYELPGILETSKMPEPKKKVQQVTERNGAERFIVPELGKLRISKPKERKDKEVVSEPLNNWDEMALLSKDSGLYSEIVAEARMTDKGSVYLSQRGEDWSTSVRVGILVDGGMRFNRVNYGCIRPKRAIFSEDL